MTARLNPYLHFTGQAREAMEFYHSVLGGDLDVNTFAESGMQVPAGEEGHVMHAQLLGVDGLALMAADVPSTSGRPTPAGFAVSLSGDDEAVLRGWWEGLSEGGTVQEPLTTAPWGDAFGMLSDRFGIAWMVNIAGRAAQGEAAAATAQV